MNRMNRHLLIIGLSFCLISGAFGRDLSFWVWQRTSPLSPVEIAELRQAGTTELYWQVGTLGLHDSHWYWKEQFSANFQGMRHAASFLHFIPVVRLEPERGESISPEAQAKLAGILEDTVRATGSDSLQIDYECPDRLMGNYADFLSLLKKQGCSWRLSISALGHWSRFANSFAGLTDEITPMFYDLNPGRESLTNKMLPPLLDPAATEKQIGEWQSCKVPWKAGLPGFGRVTVTATTGISRGNIRDWDLDELWFSPLLAPLQPTTGGQTVFTVTKPGVIADTPVQAQEQIVIRYPDSAALIKLRAVAEQAGAAGVIFFRLAGSDGMAACSPALLGQSASGQPALTVHRTASGCITVTNDSAYDLMPAVSPSGIRGYALELQAPAGSWREAIPGDFANVTTDQANSDMVGLNTNTIFLWFSHLRAGETLTSGLVENLSPDPPRWQIHGFDPDTLWHFLE